MTSTVRGWSPQHRHVVDVRWRGGVVTDIEPTGPVCEKPPDGEPVVVPGLVDLQVNGFRGHDVNAADVTPDTIAAITEAMAEVGVTTWVPTVVTAPEPFIHHALEQVTIAIARHPEVAAAVPMVHVEGPFISDLDGARGVHDPACIRPLDADEVCRWTSRHPVVGIVTVSPHAQDAPEQISRIVDLGVTVSIGDTHASTAQLHDAVEAGASLATHLGNGIPSLLPRHPNAIWTLLADDRVTAGLIADGHHLPADVLTVMLRAKTATRAFLVSDSTTLAGQAPGRYDTPVGGQVDVSVDGRLSFVGTDLLAGAGRHLADGVRHLVSALGVPWSDVVGLASDTPGRLLGTRRRYAGLLEPGGPANLVLLEPSGPEVGALTRVVRAYGPSGRGG